MNLLFLTFITVMLNCHFRYFIKVPNLAFGKRNEKLEVLLLTDISGRLQERNLFYVTSMLSNCLMYCLFMPIAILPQEKMFLIQKA